MTLNTLQRLAENAAVSAGKTILQKQQQELQITIKNGGESLASQVLTDADIASQQIILDALAPTLSKYNLGLLTEESEDDQSRFSKDYFWCIDPLDGTLPFTEGKDGFAVSIALISKDGTAVLGVVYDPKHQQLFTANVHSTLLLNDAPITKNRDANQFYWNMDRSLLKTDDFKAFRKKVEQHCLTYNLELIETNHQGAVMNACSLLQCTNGIYFKPPKTNLGGGSIWDYAASSCLFHLANHTATSFNGSALKLNEQSTFMNEQGVMFSVGNGLDIRW